MTKLHIISYEVTQVWISVIVPSKIKQFKLVGDVFMGTTLITS